MKELESLKAKLVNRYDSELTQHDQNAPSGWKILIFEMIGTALLTLGVNNSAEAKIADIFVATSLFVAIIFSGPFSGGHVNPAVTLGTLSMGVVGFVGKSGGISLVHASIFWAGQILGGILGALLGLFTTGKINAPDMTFENSEYLISDLMGESIGTFLFVFFILLVTNEVTTFSTNTLTTWASIAGALYIGRHFAIRSGGCLNPGVAFGMELTSYMLSPNAATIFKRAWVYIIGPALGGYLAGTFFDKAVTAREQLAE